MKLRMRRSAALVLLLFLVAGGYVGHRLAGPWPIDTDILSLLPGTLEDPVLAASIGRANAAASSRVALLIEGGTPEDRHQAATALTAALAAEGLVTPGASDGAELWAWAFAHRDRLLCAEDRARLRRGEGPALAQEVLLQWYSPFSISNGALLQSDPFLLTPRFVFCLAARALQGAPLEGAELVTGRLAASAFRLDLQDQVAARIDSWQRDWQPRGLTLARAGAVFHAAHGAAEARAEMSTIGGITLVLILGLYLVVFRSLRPPLLALTLIACCLVTALAVTLLLFGQVHVMVLVFGAASIGLVIDYTTYFLLTGLGAPELDPATRARSIRHPLTVGMVTTVGAFAALLAAPIAAFREIAVFGASGLLAAWLAALFLLPSLEGRVQGARPLVRRLQRWLDRWLGWTPPRSAAWLAAALALGLAVAGWSQGRVLDDVRQFQAPSPVLAAEERRVQAATGFAPARAYLLVTGASREQAIASEEALLDHLADQGIGGVTFAASLLDPSAARAEQDRLLLREALLAPQLGPLLAALGAPAADPYASLAPAADLALPAFATDLRGETRGIHWSIVPLSGDPPAGDLVSGAAAGDWTLVEPAAHYSALLTHYRGVAMLGLVGALVAAGLVLLLAYRRLAALWILLPVTLALVLTPAITALAGLPFSFFSAMGLLVVIGTGVDYGIFQWERPADSGRWTRLGIAIAATMTCISVGLLGLSSVLPVKSFGITVALGVALAIGLSPLVRRGRAVAESGAP